MNLKAYEGVTIDQCPVCQGTWLDAGEITPIVKQIKEPFSEAQKITAIRLKGDDHREAKTIACPKCSSPMETYQYAMNSGVIVDRCPKAHGMWFDHGELEKIQIVMEEVAIRRGDHSGAVLQKPKVTSRLCPRDKTPLKSLKYESEAVDACTTCGGLWCDDQELGNIVRNREVVFGAAQHPELAGREANAKVVGESELVSTLSCVTCARMMRRSNYSYSSGIIIDRCTLGHGVWLDGVEIEKVQVFAERWSAEENRLRASYGKLLRQVGVAAAAAFDRSVQEGADKGQYASTFGRFVKRVW